MIRLAHKAKINSKYIYNKVYILIQSIQSIYINSKYIYIYKTQLKSNLEYKKVRWEQLKKKKQVYELGRDHKTTKTKRMNWVAIDNKNSLR